MGWFKDTFFGKDPELEVQRHSTLTNEQDTVLRELLNTFRGQGGANFQPEEFGGDLSAGLSEGEMVSLEALEQRSVANATSPLGDMRMEALMEIISNRGQSGGDFQDFFRTNVQNPALRDFEENVQPSIGRNFGGSSFFSSDRAKADSQAEEALIRTLTGARSSLAFQDRESSADRLLRAIGLSSDVESSETDNIIKSLDAFGVEREVEQAGIDREFSEFNRQQGERNNRIAQILAALGIQGVENVGQVKPGSSGLVQDFLSGVASGAGAGLGGRTGRK